MEKINQNLLDCFINNAKIEDLRRAIREIITTIRFRNNYNSEEYVNNLIDVIANINIVKVKDIDKEVFDREVPKIFNNNWDIIVKDSIKIEGVDNIFKELWISYLTEGTDYRYSTKIDIASIEGLVKIS